MSVITNVILIHSGSEDYIEQVGFPDHYPIVDAVNSWLFERRHAPLCRLDQYAGGGKVFTESVYLGAFNHLDVDGLVELVRSLPWRYPESVQLLVKGEDDIRFTERLGG